MKGVWRSPDRVGTPRSPATQRAVPPFLFLQGIDSFGQIKIKFRQPAFAVR
jgi:hypothetical protein